MLQQYREELVRDFCSFIAPDFVHLSRSLPPRSTAKADFCYRSAQTPKIWKELGLPVLKLNPDWTCVVFNEGFRLQNKTGNEVTFTAHPPEQKK